MVRLIIYAIRYRNNFIVNQCNRERIITNEKENGPGRGG